ncbi:MAG: tripartite tricarboxylate transporter substrate binding protein [Rubrivivax sp.]|nr:tripartite tricarboxylate transporter substrate binding protein [Rubrivivax sp.]
MTPTRHPARSALLAAATSLFAAFALATAASAQDAWPSKPIRIVVPYPAGGTTDQLARAIQQPLQELLGQTVIVENRAGAAGTLGTDSVAKSAPDGYTFVFGNSGPSATASLMRKLPYDVLKDFKPVSTVVMVPLILAVAADSPHKSVKDFIAWAKAQGTSLNFGSTGVGSSSHLTGEFFNERAGTKLQHVPYQGGAPMVTAFAGGQVHMAFVTGLDGAAMVQAGRIRYLAAATPQRSEVLPGLPAIAEDVPGFASVVWFGVLAPRGVPDDIVGRLNAAIVKAVARPEVRKLFVDRNVEPRSNTPAEFDKLIRDELELWAPVIRKADIKS